MVKICGLRTPAGTRLAHDAGADAVGTVVRAPDSPRQLPLETAREVLAARAPSQLGVAVTVSRDPDELLTVTDALDPDVLQLHRSAPAATLRVLREHRPDLRVWLGASPDDLPEAPELADALLLDARTPDGYGGTGIQLDPEAARRVRDRSPVPVVLAGGLTPGNVADAVRQVDPHGVDVASGVETDDAKDPHLVRAFVTAARDARRTST